MGGIEAALTKQKGSRKNMIMNMSVVEVVMFLLLLSHWQEIAW